jgi:Secretion system C-terminal sorting domain
MKLKALIFTILFTVLISSAFSWELIPGGGTSVSAYNENSTGERIILNLSYSGFWISQNSGTSWEAINDRIFPDVNLSTYSWVDCTIDMLDEEGDTIVIYTLGRIAYSLDGGESWERIFPPRGNVRDFKVDPDNHQHLYSMSNLYTSTGASFLVQSFDFGETWSESRIVDESGRDTGIQNFEISPNDPDLLYAASFALSDNSGNQNSGIYKSADGGLTWTSLFDIEDYREYFVNDRLEFNDILPLSNGDIIVILNETRTLRSVDSGLTWIVDDEALPTTHRVTNIVESTEFPGHVLAYDMSLTYSWGTYISTDFGASYTLFSSPITDQHVNTNRIIVNQNSNDIFLCSVGQGVLKSADGGINWIEAPSPESFGSQNHFEVNENFLSTRTLFSHVSKYFNLSDETWMPINDNSQAGTISIIQPFVQLSDGSLFTNSSSVEAESGEYNSYLSRSYDNAETWVNTSINDIPGDKGYVNKYFSDTISRLIIVGYGGSDFDFTHSVSIDTGRTWNTYDAPGNYRWGLMAQNDNYVYVGSPTDGDIFRSSDNSETWEAMNFPNADGLSDSQILIDPNSGNIYTHTRDHSYFYDGSWHHTSSMTFLALTLIPVEESDPILLAFSDDFLFYISYDNGYTWTHEESIMPYSDSINWGFPPTMEYDSFRDRVWVSTPFGMMYSNVGDLVSVDDPNGSVIPDEFEILTAYPNPFNNTTQITYKLKNPSDIKLKLYNIEGREVMDIFEGKKSVGEHSISLSSSTLATGIYFLKLESGSKTTVKKLTLLK